MNCHFEARANWIKRPPRNRVTARQVIRSVAASRKLHPEDITGRSRLAVISKARAEIAGHLRLQGLSYPQIGRALGGRHHATVMTIMRRHGYYCAATTQGQAND